MNMNNILGVHHVLVSALVILFLWRVWFVWQGQAIPFAWLRRGLPDAVDISVLVSGLALAWVGGYKPWEDAWFAVKLLLILGYIVLGLIAFRPVRPLRQRRAAMVLALGLLVSIAYLAIYKP